jgi:hypothetical protein
VLGVDFNVAVNFKWVAWLCSQRRFKIKFEGALLCWQWLFAIDLSFAFFVENVSRKRDGSKVPCTAPDLCAL